MHLYLLEQLSVRLDEPFYERMKVKEISQVHIQNDNGFILKYQFNCTLSITWQQIKHTETQLSYDVTPFCAKMKHVTIKLFLIFFDETTYFSWRVILGTVYDC